MFLQAGLSANVSIDTHSAVDSTAAVERPALMGAMHR
jgi:hypothetical protein